MSFSKSLLLVVGLDAFRPAAAQKSDYPVPAVPFTQVKLTDSFWLPRLKITTDVTIPASFQRCESTSRVKSFELAVAHQGKFATVFLFDGSDIYKTIEGRSYSLSVYPDAKPAAYIDKLIKKVGAAQEPDGYLSRPAPLTPPARNPGPAKSAGKRNAN